jgi:deazaflavin-dependent oxidoreductase (nitroreductase family)
VGSRNSFATLTGRILQTRALVRAPVGLYRLGFGFLFGDRMLLLEHRGRHSGVTRYAVLEVVDHPAPDTYVIVSGFGETSQWYRNVIADPRVRISVGWRRSAAAVARLLRADDTEIVLAQYSREHPRAWKQLRRTLEEGLHADVRRLPMFAIQLSAL